MELKEELQAEVGFTMDHQVQAKSSSRSASKSSQSRKSSH